MDFQGLRHMTLMCLSCILGALKCY
uniref:Uncharacterized protein n=1 Tax=Anguilla anguilla TaxID=7936 RepID=A0A0E9XFH0_ANGAN